MIKYYTIVIWLIILLMHAGCSSGQKSHKDIALDNLFMTQVKFATKSETWRDHKCTPPKQGDTSDYYDCTVTVFDEYQEIVSMRNRRYSCSPRENGSCIEY